MLISGTLSGACGEVESVGTVVFPLLFPATFVVVWPSLVKVADFRVGLVTVDTSLCIMTTRINRSAYNPVTQRSVNILIIVLANPSRDGMVKSCSPNTCSGPPIPPTLAMMKDATGKNSIEYNRSGLILIFERLNTKWTRIMKKIDIIFLAIRAGNRLNMTLMKKLNSSSA